MTVIDVPPFGGTVPDATVPDATVPDATVPDATVPADASTTTDDRRWSLRRLWRGRPADPTWYRPALLGLLVATGIAYIWGLGASGWANSYYSAAVQAGASSWKAFFFGSFDASNAITVDKAPAALWVMGISARIFGVNSWSILVPQALMGVGSVALVVASVKRWFRPGAALLAGVVLATTPVAALMFRFNNPDALLMLLLCGAAYAVTRAVEHASWRWLTLAGSLVGFAFLAKMLQSFLVLPAFALVYLLAAPTTFWRRIGHLTSMGVATIVAAGWWIAIVELWPASSRPYIGGSQDNSVMELVLGYNGLGRLTGNETGSVGGGGAAGSGQWGPTGWFRMFNSSFGGQISWLLPAALLLLLAGVVWTVRRPRTDRDRAGVLLWGGWLVVTGITFSLSKGIIHEYYAVALAPAIGALVGIGASMAWDRREHVTARMVMAATVVATAGWTWVLLGRTTDWNTWLQPTVVALSVIAVALLLIGDRVRRGAVSALGVGAVLAVGAGLVAPIAASATTIATPHTGAIVTAGPSMGGGTFGPGGTGGPPGMPTGAMPTGGPPAGLPTGGAMPSAAMPSGGFPGGMPPGPGNTGTGTNPTGGTGTGGGTGGLLDAATPSAEVVDTLTKGADDYDWVVATIGAMSGAGYQLATGEPVLAIGGFNGSDRSPTLAGFKEMVADGRIHYFVAGGMAGPMGAAGSASGGSNASSEISTWVTSNFTSTTVDGVTLYDLTT